MKDVRAARAALNDAIAARDVDAIVAHLLPSYQIVTARNATRHSREESRASWIALFASDANVVYVRTPTDIRVNEALGQAHENGEWEGSGLRGVYSAKWLRDEDGEWRLQAEIFSTL
jgi:ketosteroid isomerase-like protein